MNHVSLFDFRKLYFVSRLFPFVRRMIARIVGRLKFRAVLSIIVVMLMNQVSAAEYVFRSDERPAFDKTISVQALEKAQVENVLLIDVRLKEDYLAAPNLIPGAVYLDPEKIEQWSESLPKGKKVVAYCVKGQWVSQKAAHYLNSKGLDVYSLEGGIQAWNMGHVPL